MPTDYGTAGLEYDRKRDGGKGKGTPTTCRHAPAGN
jgi:hypothetical protein